jgi:flavin-dependent dehydrogenase
LEVAAEERMHEGSIEFDVAVIGAGPAGSSAAITAARCGARVGLFEAGEFPRHKVCGEFVSAESLDVLRDLLRSVPGAVAVLRDAPVIDQVRLLLDGSMASARIEPAGLSVARYDLDALLWEASKRAGVECRSGCEVRAISGAGPFLIETSQGAFQAASVVAAAGRWSRFTPRDVVPSEPKWIGLKAHFREQQPPLSSDLYFFEHGYCGVQPIANDVINACAMVRSDRATSLEEVFALHPTLAARRRDWQPITAPVTTAPLIYRTPQPVKDNLMFVGDSAAFIDPFVGDGISIALRTGQFVATSLMLFLRGSGSLADALAEYDSAYRQHIAPLISTASRVRRLLSLPKPVQAAVMRALRLPGVMPFVIRRTRKVA